MTGIVLVGREGDLRWISKETCGCVMCVIHLVLIDTGDLADGGKGWLHMQLDM